MRVSLLVFKNKKSANKKHWYLIHTSSNKAFKNTVVHWALLCLHGGLDEITLTVTLKFQGTKILFRGKTFNFVRWRGRRGRGRRWRARRESRRREKGRKVQRSERWKNRRERKETWIRRFGLGVIDLFFWIGLQFLNKYKLPIWKQFSLILNHYCDLIKKKTLFFKHVP